MYFLIHRFNRLTNASPSKGLYTNKLLTYLNSKDLKATFFLVGPRIISRPEIVVYEHMNGHELGQNPIVTSHSFLLTSLLRHPHLVTSRPHYPDQRADRC